jgi:hypothetical protein
MFNKKSNDEQCFERTTTETLSLEKHAPGKRTSCEEVRE